MSEIFISIFLSIGLFLIISSILSLPSIKESRQLHKLNKPKKSISFEKLLIMPAAVKLSGVIRISKYNKEQLKNKLASAGMKMSAEVYTARYITITAFIFLFALIWLLLKIYIVAAAFIILSVIAYSKVKGEVDDMLKEKREAIKKELPRFMRTVIQSLLYNRDMVTIIDKYRNVCGEELEVELKKLVTEMKSGNHEEALSNFEKRIGIDFLTTFVTGLISESKGIDQKEFLKSTEKEMKKLMVENLKRDAFKKPDKLRFAQMILFINCAAIWLISLVIQVLSGLNLFNQF